MHAHARLIAVLTLGACRSTSVAPATEPVRTTGGHEAAAEAASAAPSSRPASPTDRVSPSKSGFTVVELFGSEGCSSCPAADNLLLRLEREDAHLIVLGFHVDYWNGSWRDRFSSAAITARQRDYSNAFRARGLYTPQAVINGRQELVGSDESGVRAAIERAHADEAQLTLTLATSAPTADSIAITTTASDVPSTPTTLTVAITEDGIEVRPTRGENAGASLAHVAVVRAISSAPLAGTSTIRLAFPSDLHRENAHVIALVAEDASRAIVGATRIGLVR